VRIACLRVAELPLAAELRASPELRGEPLAVLSGPGSRAESIAVSDEAARRGVRRATSLVHARAVCPELRTRIASPALDRAARAALLDAALGCSPRAAPAPRASGAWAAEAVVFVDASGVTSLFQSERGFATALVARAERLGLPAVASVASSRSVAHIVARTLEAPGDCLVLPPGAEAAFLSRLSLDVLDVSDALGERLTRFGVRTVGDLLALPRRALAQRLGPDALQLVARARGEEKEPPLPAPGAGLLCEAVDLEAPVDRLEPLAFVLQGLLSRLLERLEARQRACADLLLELGLEGGGRDARRVGLASPTLELRVLMRLVCHALETRPPEAPVVSAALSSEGRAAASDQLDLFRPTGPAPSALERTLAELEALCGSGRVGAPERADDHRPDRFGMRPFPIRRAAPPPAEEDPSPSPRIALAVRALRPPVPAQVWLRSGRPERIRSAIANGDVVHVAGPWRTTGGWWTAEQRFAYDHFDVQIEDGTMARLRFDHVRKRWELDAIYD
jgi:protein ImuB